MELLTKIFDAGVVGAGGAGFPTHIKLNCKVEYLIINAAECEPLLYTDKYLLNNYAKEIVKAAEEVSKHVEAKTCFIAIKGVNEKEILTVTNAINELGSFVKIFSLSNYYPAGDEQMLVYDITNRTVPHQGIPLNVGALVSNASTMLNIYGALHDIPITHKYLTVTGDVNNAAVLKAPIGISLKECLTHCGGAKYGNFKAISGGPMMGKIYDKNEFENQVVTKTTSGVIIVNETGNFLSKLKDTDIRKTLNRAKSACIQCSFCTELCPRGLIGHNLRPNKIMRHMASVDLDNELPMNVITKEALLCCECGICEAYACPMGLSPRQVNIHIKKQLQGKKYDIAMPSYTASQFREYRKIAPKKIMARMGLSGLYNTKVSDYKEITAELVKIPLRQHIGAPASPCVNEGEIVKAGQLIANGVFENVSANIHASISGKIVKICDYIEILGGV